MKRKKHNKIVMLARIKLNTIDRYEVSHEDFETIINEEKKNQELKENIRMINSQRSDAEKVKLIQEGKNIFINEAIKHNEIINSNLRYKYV